jgi:hypothetical protein
MAAVLSHPVPLPLQLAGLARRYVSAWGAADAATVGAMVSPGCVFKGDGLLYKEDLTGGWVGGVGWGGVVRVGGWVGGGMGGWGEGQGDVRMRACSMRIPQALESSSGPQAPTLNPFPTLDTRLPSPVPPPPSPPPPPRQGGHIEGPGVLPRRPHPRRLHPLCCRRQ